MRKKLIYILIGTLLYSIVFSFLSGDIHITNLLANFVIPIIPSLGLTIIIELIKIIAKKGYKFNNFIELFHKIWLIIIIILAIGNSISYMS